MTKRILATLVAAVLACGACTGRQTPLSKASMEHGIRPGTQLDSARLPCLTGGDRTVGRPRALQIVTFATPYDCSACTPHMRGVPKVLQAMNASEKAFVVVWAPNRAAFSRGLGRAQSPLPICVDQKGIFWDRYDIQHTPFTVVIDDGRVVYSNDATFRDGAAEKQFANDLRVLFAHSESGRGSRSAAAR